MSDPKEYTIRTPNPAFSGTRGPVTFVNGVGTTTDEAVARRLAEAGYTVDGITADTPTDETVQPQIGVPIIGEVRVPLTDPDGVVRERSVAVVGGLTGGSQNGPDWTTLAEAKPTDTVAFREARQEYTNDAEVIRDQTAQELEKLRAGTPEPFNPQSAGGADPAPRDVEQLPPTPDGGNLATVETAPDGPAEPEPRPTRGSKKTQA